MRRWMVACKVSEYVALLPLSLKDVLEVDEARERGERESGLIV